MAAIDVPAKQSEVVTVDAANVQAALIDSGYYAAADFTGLGEAAAPAAEVGLLCWYRITDQRRTPLDSGRNPLQRCFSSRWL